MRSVFWWKAHRTAAQPACHAAMDEAVAGSYGGQISAGREFLWYRDVRSRAGIHAQADSSKSVRRKITNGASYAANQPGCKRGHGLFRLPIIVPLKAPPAAPRTIAVKKPKIRMNTMRNSSPSGDLNRSKIAMACGSLVRETV